MMPRDENILSTDLWGTNWGRGDELEFSDLFDSWVYAIWSDERPPAPTETFATLLALLKAHPDRNWVKSMFVDPDGRTVKRTVEVDIYKRDPVSKKLTSAKVDLTRDDLSPFSDSFDFYPPLWSLCLVKAAEKNGWQLNGGDVKSLLEILTGFEAVEIQDPSVDQIEAASKTADVGPVLIAIPEPENLSLGQDVSWEAVMTATEDSFVLGSALNTGFRDEELYESKPLDARAPVFHSPIVKYPESITSHFSVGPGQVKKLVTLKDFKGFTRKPGGDPV